jgi:hypothetical protein
MNVELRMWNFELVARRAMKNYSIKNYLASYSIFLLVSPSLLGFLSPGNGGTEGGVKTIEDGRGSVFKTDISQDLHTLQHREARNRHDSH